MWFADSQLQSELVSMHSGSGQTSWSLTKSLELSEKVFELKTLDEYDPLLYVAAAASEQFFSICVKNKEIAQF